MFDYAKKHCVSQHMQNHDAYFTCAHTHTQVRRNKYNSKGYGGSLNSYSYRLSRSSSTMRGEQEKKEVKLSFSVVVYYLSPHNLL